MAQTNSETWLSPNALVAARDGRTVFVGCGTAAKVLVCDLHASTPVHTIELPGPTSGLALSPDESRLYATCPAVASQVCEIDLKARRVGRSFPGLHTATSPVVAGDGKRIYVCQRFSSCVSLYDLENGLETARIPVAREPIAAALSYDDRFLFVAHHLPQGRADNNLVAASVSVIDVQQRCVTRTLCLPNGSSLLRQIRISPDGQYACLTHNLARYQMPTTQLERGWMNTSALTIIDVQTQSVLNTVLLDDIDRGAANPWALAWTGDGRRLCVTHAGTHEVSVIQFPELVAKLRKLPHETRVGPNAASVGLGVADVPNDLAFLVGLRQRIKLKGNGPRCLAVVSNTAWVGSYFSDTLQPVDLTSGRADKPCLALQPAPEISNLRRGEMLFNDASICFQQWQSCGSCHSEDGRVDGLNWDLLNDGLGNPKNTKSLLLAHQTPPAMSTGVRETAETAVRAGIQHILFSVQPEAVALALDTWLKSLAPLPSPHLVSGGLSAAARRGQRLFQSARVGCAGCHPAPLWTNLRQYDVGTAGAFDREGEPFDTPSLAELWRTAPYLHDGSAASLRDVLITRNASDRHGRTSDMSNDQIEDLLQYLLSL